MKKIFTLLVVLLGSVLGMVAQNELYEFYYQSGKQAFNDAAKNSNFFTVAGGDQSSITSTITLPYTGEKVTTNKGFKANSTGKVTFTIYSKAIVTIFQNNKKSDSERFPGVNDAVVDGWEIVEDYSETGLTDTNNRLIKREFEPGTYTISRDADGGKELTFVYVGVEIISSGLQRLSNPEITYDAQTGEVTISNPAENGNAEVRYTTDGSVPTTESELYTAPFVVADNTKVTAMAMGDGVSTENSAAVDVTVYLENGAVEAPVFAQFNGTFAITCATANSAIEYSLDGSNYLPYTIPVTVAETTTVYARATREGWTTAEANVEVTALPVPEHTTTLYFGMGGFEGKGTTTLTGVETDTDTQGFSLYIDHKDNKTWGEGDAITISEGLTRKSFVGSNGAPVVMTVPDKYKVTRITLYSYMPTLGRASAWNNVNGESNNSANIVPLLSQDRTNPDVRVFNIEQEGNTITFCNTGERPNFVMAVDVIDLTLVVPDVEEPTPNKNADGAVVSLTFNVPEGHNLYYRYVETNPASMGETNAPMREAAETLEHEGQTFTLLHGDTLPVEKDGTLYYFAHNPETDARSEVKSMAVSGTTSLVEISAEAGMVEYYNLQGIRVAAPAEGVYIRKQGDNVSKVYVK